MKNDATMTFLNLVLAVLIIAAVGFAFLSMSRERELRRFTVTAAAINNNLARANALLNEVAVYNAKYPSPELTQIIHAAQRKPAPAKPAAPAAH